MAPRGREVESGVREERKMKSQEESERGKREREVEGVEREETSVDGGGTDGEGPEGTVDAEWSSVLLTFHSVSGKVRSHRKLWPISFLVLVPSSFG